MDDLDLLRFIAWLIELVPGLKWASTSDSVEEFSRIMTRQLDLRLESANMSEFYRNFKDIRDVVIPRVYPEWTSENVLIESYQEGIPISKVREGKG